MRIESLFSVLIVSLTGCATVYQGAVMRKTGADEVQVGVGPDDVLPGDKVVLYYHECRGVHVSPILGHPKDETCHSKVVGEGIVVSTIDKRSSLVRLTLDKGVKAGTLVEKSPAVPATK